VYFTITLQNIPCQYHITYSYNFKHARRYSDYTTGCRLRLKCDGIRTEIRFCLSAKRTNPFKSAGASVQSTTGSRGVLSSGSNAGYTMFRGSVKRTGYTLHSPVSPSVPPRASPCSITIQLNSTRAESFSYYRQGAGNVPLSQTDPRRNLDSSRWVLFLRWQSRWSLKVITYIRLAHTFSLSINRPT
jgi:hypothetical protein